MLATLTSADFEPFINNLFQLNYKGSNAASLRLVAIEEYPKAARNHSVRTPFSLMFCATNNATVADSCFTLQHPELGELKDIYINRILPPDPQDSRPHYQAVFN